jgi:hypothetical protein
MSRINVHDVLRNCPPKHRTDGLAALFRLTSKAIVESGIK